MHQFRLQIQGEMRSKVGGVKYRGMIQTAIGIAKEEVREIIVIIQVISNLTAWFMIYILLQSATAWPAIFIIWRQFIFWKIIQCTF